MLFDNLTALFCPPTPTPIRQAFISAGGQIATERSVLESKPIDVYVAVWGQEDPIVARYAPLLPFLSCLTLTFFASTGSERFLASKLLIRAG